MDLRYDRLDPLPREFYRRETVSVARDLLGKTLVRAVGGEVLLGKIVETEAYKGLSDPASHAYKGNRGRASIMFGEVGYAYVYFTYGNHFCMNVVAKSRRAKAGAVLIRSLEPLYGVGRMLANRGDVEEWEVSRGPGNLTKALSIDRSFNGHDLTRRGELFVAGELDQTGIEDRIESSTRIGIRRATTKKWRFYVSGNRCVSRYTLKT